jgi:predicted ATPase/DNA-binding NarL/FixJ family response regulator
MVTATPSLERHRPAQLLPDGPAVVGNVPYEVNGFVGREATLLELGELLTETRLLTLVGPGGVGKTRLALRLQREVRDLFPDGTWLVDLGPVADPTLVPQALGDVLGVQQQSGQSWMQDLVRVLRPYRLLLVLDNCEHLIGACAELIDGLLRSCLELCVLATSDRPVGVVGETVWRVPPLSLPPAAVDDIRALTASEAVRLFVARVRARLPDFAPGEHNAGVVAEICRRLDGLPLALELVAARVEGLGVAEVAARLGLALAAPAEHGALQAALDWSSSLLDDDERRVLRRLGVFVGGWTLAATEAVCGADELDRDRVVEALGRLVTRSLVVADHDGLGVRYRLLESVRSYAVSQQAAAGETDSLQERHARYMLGLAERAGFQPLNGAEPGLLAPEADNLRASLEWAVQHDRGEAGMRIASGAFPLWMATGHYVEALTWLDRLLALPSTAAPSPTRSIALVDSGRLWLMIGEYGSAEEAGLAALEEQRTRGDALAAALTLELLGDVALERGELAEADRLHGESAWTKGALGHERLMVTDLLECGLVANEAGDVERVRQLVGQIEAMAETEQQPRWLAGALQLRALAAVCDGDLAGAASLLERALEVCQPANDPQGIVMLLSLLGHVRLDQGQRLAALDAFLEAMQRAQGAGQRIRLIRVLEGCGRCLVASDPDAAVRVAGATDAQRSALGAQAYPSEQRYLDGWLAQARRVLGARAFARAWEDGHASTLSQAVSLAEALTVGLRPTPAPTRVLLTPREQEVAILLAQGLTNKQVAAQLVLSTATVRSHVEHILTKLDLRSRAQIAAWASQQGLLG